MPNRIVREGMLSSRAVSSVSEEAALLYVNLMLIVDDFGRIEEDLDIIRLRCFPFRLDAWPVERIGKCLTEVGQVTDTLLSDDGHSLALVSRYSVGPKKYLQINNFRQRTRSKNGSRYPGPPARDGHSSDSGRSRAHVFDVVVDVGGVVDVDVGGGYRSDESFQEFVKAYEPIKESGIHSATLSHAYSEIIAIGGQPEHDKLMAGLKRMSRCGKDYKYLPRAEKFIRDKEYLQSWEPENGRTELEVLEPL